MRYRLTHKCKNLQKQCIKYNKVYMHNDYNPCANTSNFHRKMNCSSHYLALCILSSFLY